MCGARMGRAYQAGSEFSAETGCLPLGALVAGGTGMFCLVEDVVEVFLVASEGGGEADEMRTGPREGTGEVEDGHEWRDG